MPAQRVVHPFTGLAAVGFRADGRPIFPIRGGSEDEEKPNENTDDPKTDPDAKPDDDDDKPLGPAGTKALEAEKQKRRDEAARRRAVEKELADLKAAKDKPSEEGTVDADAIRREAEDAATTRLNNRILRSEIKALAAKKLEDPADATLHLDLDKFEVDQDGNVDEDEIADAIDDLIKRKPYLAAQSGEKKPAPGSADGGARKGSRPNLQQQLADATKRGDTVMAIELRQQIAKQASSQ